MDEADVFPAVATGDYVVVAGKAGPYDGACRANGIPVPLSFVPASSLEVQIELFRSAITGSVTDEAGACGWRARDRDTTFFAGTNGDTRSRSVLTDDQGCIASTDAARRVSGDDADDSDECRGSEELSAADSRT